MGLKDREANRKKSVVEGMLKSDSSVKEENPKLVQRGYYITPEIAMKLKMRAVQEGKRDYDIVQEALEAYLN